MQVAVSIIYYAAVLAFAALLAWNALRAKNLQQTILYLVVLSPFVLRILRLK